MIEVKNITKKYGDKKVVNNVSLNIEKGKMISLIGPNGAGKSTVLSMISRLLDMDEGEVIIDGTPLDKWNNRELSKKISILKQANDIDLRLTIRELVEFGRFPYSQGNINEEDNRLINEAIEYMQLRDIQYKYLDELSGGQKQRAYIAMVIAQNTEYIFLDEPLNNLDMKHSVQMMKGIRALVDDLGKTVVTVLHDINFASCYSDTIIALKDGEVYKEGETLSIIDKVVLEDLYKTEFKIENIGDRRICVYF
ncbi:iron ABC transporter ATP-binding protein [Clostridium sp. LP20]|uniref:iron ABC transporter ATP-binding protein n=1 Tax=Clostridium sp. LP20 TaxID=3418665 RepID=UPI003EE52B04